MLTPLLKKLQIILLSMLFGGALSFFVWYEEYYFYVLGFLVIFNLAFVWPLAKRIRFLAIPLFLSIGSLNLLYLVDGLYERGLFIILAVTIYGLALWGANRLKKYDCDQTAQGMVNLATIITVFFWLVSNYGWYLNFNISSWVLVVTIISSTFLIILPSLTISFVACYKIYYRQNNPPAHSGQTEQVPQSKARKRKKEDFVLAFKHQIKIQRAALFFSFIIAFIMGEVIWALSLWPFGYLITGMTAVIIFFLFWSVMRKFIKKELTKRFIIVNIVIMIIVIIMMIVTSPWEVV
jgi:MFS family permease